MGRLALVVATALVVVGVASGGLAARGDPKRAITKADQARAKAMLVRKGDLAPGFTGTPSGQDTDDMYCAALDESDLTLTGDAESPNFTLQATGKYFRIGSEAKIYKTTANALASWKRGTSAAGERCARSTLTKALAGLASITSFGRLSVPTIAPLTIAYQVVIAVKSGATTVPIYADVVVLQRGRAQVALFVFSGGRPLARSEVLAFARMTGTRMAAAMRGA